MRGGMRSLLPMEAWTVVLGGKAGLQLRTLRLRTREWARIDLGSSQSVGKVVLFSRADLVDFSGTGFPSSFQIQGSSDGNNWTTLVNLVDYSGAKAGEGQVFTFLAQDVRLVQVLGTVLGGVGTEFGYRMQLAEIEVYA
jgi:hypothetical protein